jgi:hypothetical protein
MDGGRVVVEVVPLLLGRDGLFLQEDDGPNLPNLLPPWATGTTGEGLNG